MPKPKPLPPVEVLRELLHYAPSTGVITFRTFNHRHRKGDPLTRRNSAGYLVWTFDYQTFYAHRLAWKLYTGEEPPEVVDHVNRNKADNRWKNLRASDNTLNRYNMTPWGIKRLPGVQTKGKKFYAKISINGTQVYLGAFETEMDAHLAYRKAHIHQWGSLSIYAERAS